MKIPKDLVGRAKEVLELPAMRIKPPEYMRNQKKLVEFARDVANFIISLEE